MAVELSFSESDVHRFEKLLAMQSEQPGTSLADWADRELAIRAKLDSLCPYERGLPHTECLIQASPSGRLFLRASLHWNSLTFVRKTVAK